ncbi:MAG: hypothetical protein JJU28_09410 [Cyclobacteriaceae bacterium]|nr:hypothetical protein [Cyclobacteriaceae bacterium]
MNYFNTHTYYDQKVRFLGVDPQNQFASPYTGMGNNPVMMVDPDGEFVFSAILPGIGTFIDAALWGAVINGGVYTGSKLVQDGNLRNWNLGEFGKSAAVGAISGIAGAGAGMAWNSISANVYGAVPGAVVKGGLYATSGGLGGGFGNMIMTGGAQGSFWSGFKQGAITGAIMGGVSGAREGYNNAQNSFFERNSIFGNLTEGGRKHAVLHYAREYNLLDNGITDIRFERLPNKFAEITVPNESVASAAKNYPGGVNTTLTFNSKNMVSLTKLKETLIHERQHAWDFKNGWAHKLLLQVGGKDTRKWQALMEIRAHNSAKNFGFRRGYNQGRINHWYDIFIK